MVGSLRASEARECFLWKVLKWRKLTLLAEITAGNSTSDLVGNSGYRSWPRDLYRAIGNGPITNAKNLRVHSLGDWGKVITRGDAAFEQGKHKR